MAPRLQLLLEGCFRLLEATQLPGRRRKTFCNLAGETLLLSTPCLRDTVASHWNSHRTPSSGHLLHAVCHHRCSAPELQRRAPISAPCFDIDSIGVDCKQHWPRCRCRPATQHLVWGRTRLTLIRLHARTSTITSSRRANVFPIRKWLFFIHNSATVVEKHVTRAQCVKTAHQRTNETVKTVKTQTKSQQEKDINKPGQV